MKTVTFEIILLYSDYFWKQTCQLQNRIIEKVFPERQTYFSNEFCHGVFSIEV